MTNDQPGPETGGEAPRVEVPLGPISRHLTSGSLIPFLGAGASIVPVKDGPPLPLGRALARRLAIDFAYPTDDGSPDDLAMVASYCEKVNGTREDLKESLHQIFDRRVEPAAPPLSPGIEAPLLILTTNYDELIETPSTMPAACRTSSSSIRPTSGSIAVACRGGSPARRSSVFVKLRASRSIRRRRSSTKDARHLRPHQCRQRPLRHLRGGLCPLPRADAVPGRAPGACAASGSSSSATAPRLELPGDAAQARPGQRLERPRRRGAASEWKSWRSCAIPRRSSGASGRRSRSSSATPTSILS